jgi:serine phosphatase RsbU (regulator of sigma subunit)
VLLLVGIVYDLATPPEFTASPLFSAAPLVGAPLLSLRATVGIGLASAAAEFSLHVRDHTVTETQSITEQITVLTVVVLAVFINRVVYHRDRRLASARGIAEAAQRAVVPTPAERLGGLRIAARYQAAHVDAAIGGDLYAVQDTRYGVRLLIGDVRGKGLEAVGAVAVIIGCFREAVEQEPTLEGIAARLEQALRRAGGQRAEIDQFEGFTTAVLAEAVPALGELRLLNRGHPAPLLLFADGSVRSAEPTEAALPLGMGVGMGQLGQWPDRVDELDFPVGATLLLFTDGVTEARDSEGVFYSPEERLNGRHFADPEELLDAVIEDVARHTGGESADDMALLAVSRPGERQPRRRRRVGLVPGGRRAGAEDGPGRHHP